MKVLWHLLREGLAIYLFVWLIDGPIQFICDVIGTIIGTVAGWLFNRMMEALRSYER
ncbi:MAG TPA: hypothetical protein VK789_28420 [Bryobacteraceae bacterium]|jgi:hypothetical protein|nr:hypothetical protein [Bryobacteraceae bacterium]